MDRLAQCERGADEAYQEVGRSALKVQFAEEILEQCVSAGPC